jgi:CRISPR system Cascade subunit CasC
MSRFLQLHLLTFYPPANLNRDDAGRPKTAVMGGAPRLRVSSQWLKRAWRTSALFGERLAGHLAERTQRLGEAMREHLVARGVAEAVALRAARDVAALFGKLKAETDDNPARIEQLAFVGPEERAAALEAAERVAAGEPAPRHADLLRRSDTAVDVAMFGRMLADAPDFNREAAVQVAHAVTTHRALVEDDFYTAVDDLKRPSEDAGAGFVGEQGFGSGVFYLYLCADLSLLARNLGGALPLAGEACAALAEAAATVGPAGKQASFASRARAHYLLAERGDAQPRTLAGAFVPAADGPDPVDASVAALRAWRGKLDRAYGPSAEATAEMDVAGGTGTLDEVSAFCRAAAEGAPRG